MNRAASRSRGEGERAAGDTSQTVVSQFSQPQGAPKVRDHSRAGERRAMFQSVFTGLGRSLSFWLAVVVTALTRGRIRVSWRGGVAAHHHEGDGRGAVTTLSGSPGMPR